jgi:hypothetical protein
MNPYLVTATDGAGKRDSFVRQAESLEHLRNVLEREGYRDVEYLDDEFSARLRAQRPAEARGDSPAAARFEAQSRRGAPPPRQSEWLLAAKNNWLLLLIDFGFIAYGLARGRIFLVLAGAGLLLWWLWTVYKGLGKANDYNALLRAHAVGDATECLRLIEQMSADPALSGNGQLHGDLAFRRAGLKARQGDLASALADAEVLRTRPECANGAFESRVASIYYQAGDMPGYLRSMETSFEASGQAATQRLDLAFGHARVGDQARARELLAAVDTSLMPPFHVPLAIAAEGVLREREGDGGGAIEKLREAVRALEPFTGNVVFWPFHGILVARFAAALARAGRRAEALAELQPWREVALNSSDPDTRRILETELAS